MKAPLLARVLKWGLARIIATPAILMPYKVRIMYIRALSRIIHGPFLAFGYFSRLLLDRLRIEAIPQEQELNDAEIRSVPAPDDTVRVKRSDSSIAILFSGGTDSMCVAALMAERFSTIHLLTYCEHATRNSPTPHKNIRVLRAHFPHVRFVDAELSVDALVRFFWYERYAHNLLRHRLLVLATCGFSSLSWHVRTLQYCLDKNIHHVADGLTRELMHFPGHMDEVVKQFSYLYEQFGVSYTNPVRAWPTPPDRQFIDQLLVNRHPEFFLNDRTLRRKTTGEHLFGLGIFASPNVKGMREDFLMQHDCYPFALYNIVAFWGYLSTERYSSYCSRVASLMSEKVNVAITMLHDYQQSRATSTLARLH